MLARAILKWPTTLSYVPLRTVGCPPSSVPPAPSPALTLTKGSLALEDMAGGSFTISNGGVFGSLMGTPIINPPQSAILGMHATKMRAVVGPDVSCFGKGMTATVL